MGPQPRKVYSPRTVNLSQGDELLTPSLPPSPPRKASVLALKLNNPGGMYSHIFAAGSHQWARAQQPAGELARPKSARRNGVPSAAAERSKLAPTVYSARTKSMQAAAQAAAQAATQAPAFATAVMAPAALQNAEPEGALTRRGMRRSRVLRGVMDGVGGASTPGSLYWAMQAMQSEQLHKHAQPLAQEPRGAAGARRPQAMSEYLPSARYGQAPSRHDETLPPTLSADERRALFLSGLCDGAVHAAAALGAVGPSATVRPGRAVGGVPLRDRSRPGSAAATPLRRPLSARAAGAQRTSAEGASGVPRPASAYSPARVGRVHARSLSQTISPVIPPAVRPSSPKPTLRPIHVPGV